MHTQKLQNENMAPMAQGGSPFQWRLVLLAVAAAAWLAASSGIIMMNRLIIVDLAFPYPISISALSQAVSFVGSWIACSMLKQQSHSNVTFHLFITRIAPLGVAQGMGIWISNKLYLYLGVSFIEMARSLLPVLTMLALWQLTMNIPTRAQLIAVLCAALGSAISAWAHQAAVSMFGVFLLAINFAIEIARMVMLQYLLQSLSLGAWQSVKFMSLPAAVSLTVMMFLVEWKDMVAHAAGDVVRKNFAAFILAGSLGLMVNYISSTVIQLSTATTLKLLASARGPIVVIAAVLFFSEKVTLLQVAGYTVALISICTYQWLLAQAQAEPKPHTSQAPSDENCSPSKGGEAARVA